MNGLIVREKLQVLREFGIKLTPIRTNTMLNLKTLRQLDNYTNKLILEYLETVPDDDPWANENLEVM